jgi:hypothetical protein
MADTLNSKLNPRHVPLASQKHLGESCPFQVVNASDSIHECEEAPGASNAPDQKRAELKAEKISLAPDF